MKRSAETQSAKVDGMVKLAKSKEFKELASKDPKLRKKLPKLGAESKARLKEIAVIKAEQQKAHAALEKNLEKFLRRFGYG